MQNLFEDSRSQLLSKSKNADSYSLSNQILGKNRYQRRLHSKVAPSVKQYNEIDMNRLFRDNILDVSIEVRGETDTYIVKISFGGFLDALAIQLNRNDDKLDLRCVIRALVASFNGDNVYIHCSCPDWRYRMDYWAHRNNIASTEYEDDPLGRDSKITNPNDTKGAGCKHVMLVLSNNSWVVKVASVITNYINYMEKHYSKLYADVIYPAIYNRKYEEPVQLDLDSGDELKTDKDTIDVSNKWAKTKSQFKKDNEYRFTAQDKPINKQVNFDDLISDTED